MQHSTFACSVRVRRPARVRVHVPDCACVRVRTRARVRVHRPADNNLAVNFEGDAIFFQYEQQHAFYMKGGDGETKETVDAARCLIILDSLRCS